LKALLILLTAGKFGKVLLVDKSNINNLTVVGKVDIDDFVDGGCGVHLNLSDGRNFVCELLCRRDR